MRVQWPRRAGRTKVSGCVRSIFWDIRCVCVCVSFPPFASCCDSSFFTLCAEFNFTFLNGDTHDCICRMGSPPLLCRTTTSGSYRVRLTGPCDSGTCAQGKRSSYCTDTRPPVRPSAFLLCACGRLISHCSLCACIHSCVVSSVSLCPTGGMLATSDWNGRVRLCACLSVLVHTRQSC
jgi:hypothetical protein